MTLTTNQALDLKATTFRSEAEAIVQSHPDAIMTEALGSADPTLFSEIKALNGGKMIPIIGTSATGSRGQITGGALESSNVDIAQELTDLIVLQSAYQANSKVVTTVETLAQDTTNLIT